MSWFLFPKNNEFIFDTQVNLIKLTSVPFVNDIFFAKIRVLKNCSTKYQKSSKIAVCENTVNWSKKYNFRIKIYKNSETNVLEPSYLKISIRKEENGGNTYSKVGYVKINLSCFAKSQPQKPPSLATSIESQNISDKASDHNIQTSDSGEEIKRGYILEGYKGKKRLDNSMLVVSIKMTLVKNTVSSYSSPPEYSGNFFVIENDEIEAKHKKQEDSVKDDAPISLPSPTTIIPKIPSANHIQEFLIEKDSSYIAKSRPNMNSNFQNHSRNSSSESSSIHFNPRPLSDVGIKPNLQNSVLDSIISNIRSDEINNSLMDKSFDKLKTNPSPASNTQFIGKPHKVQSTRNYSNDIVSKILQTVPNITVDLCHDGNPTSEASSAQIDNGSSNGTIASSYVNR